MRKFNLMTLVFILAQSFAFAQNSSIQVQGNAEVTVAATGLMVEVSILSRENSTVKVLKEIAKTVENVGEAIQENKGMASFATQAVKVEGKWNKTEEAYEYIAVQTLTVKIDSILAYDDLMKELTSAGINQVTSVTYIIADEAAVRLALLGVAVTDAKTKAKEMSKSAGVRLGGLVQMVALPGTSGPALMMAVEDMEGSFLPSKVTIKSSVMVTYVL